MWRRGRFSVQPICFYMSLEWPSRIILVRGNHYCNFPLSMSEETIWNETEWNVNFHHELWALHQFPHTLSLIPQFMLFVLSKKPI